jgi:hypothetical protein
MCRTISATTATSDANGKPALTISKTIDDRSDFNIMADSVMPKLHPCKPTLKAVLIEKSALAWLSASQFPDQLLGCKLGVRFCRAVIRRDDAPNLISPVRNPNAVGRNDGRAPVVWLSLVDDNRICRDQGHHGLPPRTNRRGGQGNVIQARRPARGNTRTARAGPLRLRSAGPPSP